MKKIQVTNVKVDVPAQVILPNTYFTIKLVKAQLEANHVKTELDKCVLLANRNNESFANTLVQIKDKVNKIAPFLDELVNALEGEDDSSKKTKD